MIEAKKVTVLSAVQLAGQRQLICRFPGPSVSGRLRGASVKLLACLNLDDQSKTKMGSSLERDYSPNC